jgi:hypothetical protein
MNVQTIVICALAAMFAACFAILCYLAVRRRRDRAKAVHAALLLQRSDPAWQRLSRSAAGAP